MSRLFSRVLGPASTTMKPSNNSRELGLSVHKNGMLCMHDLLD
jgi:hypothetical protein